MAKMRQAATTAFCPPERWPSESGSRERSSFLLYCSSSWLITSCEAASLRFYWPVKLTSTRIPLYRLSPIVSCWLWPTSGNYDGSLCYDTSVCWYFTSFSYAEPSLTMLAKMEEKCLLRSLKFSSIDLAFFSLSECNNSEIWSSVFYYYVNFESSSSYFNLYFS